jgi:uncharacterized protein (TIGR03435 family)
MKKPASIVLALAASAGALFAQTLTGTWQGALKVPQAPNGELRIVMKISTTEKDTLKAEMISIDQNPTPIPAESVKVSGSSIRIAVPAIGGNYEGAVSSDGNTMTGTWTQGGPQPAPLTMVKATPTTAWTIPEPPPPPTMMDKNARPEFEVATIKPADPNRPGWGININRSGTFLTHNTNLSDLLKFAYSVHARQIVGAPAWIDSDKFDIEGKPDKPGLPTVDQARAMVQKLLADRFGLTFHTEKKELSAYVITVVKGGSKIKEDTSQMPGPGFGGMPARGFNVRKATMAEFASAMQAQFMEQPVVDQTGFGDTRYSFILKWTPDPTQAAGYGQQGPAPAPQAPAPDADAPPDVFSAMVQQLGLQMKSARAPVDVMVIDKVQKPSEN